MKIWIEPSALSGETENLLPPTALYGMKSLLEAGYELTIPTKELSETQQTLLLNEDIQSSDFPKGKEDGVITLESGQLIFKKGNDLFATAESWHQLCRNILYPVRKTTLTRNTKETQISLSLNLDGTGQSSINTGVVFFDHMLDQIARHGLIDLELTCKGDLEVDEHHTIEDCAIALGSAIRTAISKNKAGIQRYGFVLPMDEAQATVAIDLSDRPYLRWEVNLSREYVGDFPTEMLEHFFYTLAMNAKATLHVKADGKNEHHIIESIFKGFAKALRFAISRNERIKGILPSTKGTI
ncbi:MAG: imidazoleglycerol-phosphate dehydratase HisB [Balneolaceae bacterium]